MSLAPGSDKIEKSITDSDAFSNANRAATQFKALNKMGLSKTADVLVFDVYPPELNPDDPNKLLATQLISDLSTPGLERNANNLFCSAQVEKIYNMETVTTNITTTLKLLINTSDVQLSTINKAMEANINFLMQHQKDKIHETLAEAAKHPFDYSTEIKRILERQSRLTDASAELIQYKSLNSSP